MLGDLSPSLLSSLNPTTALLAAGAGALSYMWYSLQRPKAFPPGPAHLPVIGNVAISGRRSINAFSELKKQYGGIYSVYMGNMQVLHFMFLTKSTVKSH